jgi:hypothetical protein
LIVETLVEVRGSFPMNDLVDIAIPAQAQQAAESLGLEVRRSVTSGARIRRIPRDEAELAVGYLRDWGFAARIVELGPDGETASEAAPRAA